VNKYIKGVVIQTKNKTIISSEPILLKDALELKSIYESQGLTVYLGTELKLYKTKKLSNELNLLTIIK
jgi:hypothetical protein